ncbi:hypothetical protein H1Q59_08595 [Holosporaceae bacterium 'Namur']|nr:hypothetical protein [Holosporaceae bacterium 'Namur']
MEGTLIALSIISLHCLNNSNFSPFNEESTLNNSPFSFVLGISRCPFKILTHFIWSSIGAFKSFKVSMISLTFSFEALACIFFSS